MKLVLATHVYPLNPRAPADIPGNFLPPFIAELVKRGANVHVLAPDRHGSKIPDPVAPVTWFEWPGSNGRNLGSYNPAHPFDAARLAMLYQRGQAELQKLVRRQRADAVLACWAVPSGAFAEATRRALGTPYAVWALGSDIHTSAQKLLLRTLVKRALRGAALLYANSSMLARQVEGLSGRSCGWLPTFRTLPDVPPAELPRERINFLYAGRFEPVKGVDLLLHAFARLVSESPRMHLYLAGSGSLDAQLRTQAEALGLENVVTFVGFLPEAPLAAYLRAAHAVVIPSRAEALPVVFAEAARVGTPAVVTDVGDLGMLAREYGTAIAVAPENIDALAAGLSQMARASKSEFQRGMPQLLAKLDQGRAAEKLLNELEDVLRQTTPALQVEMQR